MTPATPPYKPEKFAALSQTELGRSLWTHLNREDMVARMETASELEKPAVLAVAISLLETFGEAALEDRVKQMIGHMIRQILERRGWTLAQSNVTVRFAPFVKASRYRRPDWTTFHVYANPADPSDFAFTDRRTAPLLPKDAEWRHYVSLQSPVQAAVAFGVEDFQHLRAEVQTRGFLRVRLQRPRRA